jgi:hypothetical protein
MFGAFNKHHGLNYFGLNYQGVLVWQGILNAHAIPLIRYPQNRLGSITYILKLGGVLHYHTKTYKENNTCITLR